jgi:hypothetical protein
MLRFAWTARPRLVQRIYHIWVVEDGLSVDAAEVKRQRHFVDDAFVLLATRLALPWLQQSTGADGRLPGSWRLLEFG